MDKKKIIFVCHGNICRSPMAEFVMKKLLADKGAAENFDISSAAVSYEEFGNDIYPPAKKKLREHHIPFAPHKAHRITQREFDNADYVILMDRSNINILRSVLDTSCGENKIHLLLDFTGKPGREIADPWYTGNFEQAFQEIKEGCSALSEVL